MAFGIVKHIQSCIIIIITISVLQNIYLRYSRQNSVSVCVCVSVTYRDVKRLRQLNTVIYTPVGRKGLKKVPIYLSILYLEPRIANEISF